jgi:tRNA C32,U32 (ribose-2'-O)-methylase TrmJ
MEISVCLVAPKSSRNVGFVARTMANFGVEQLYVSAYDGSDSPPVVAGGTRATFAHVDGCATSIRLPSPDGVEVLSYPGCDASESIGDFFTRIGLNGATLRDNHGAIVDAATLHAHAWVDRGQLDLGTGVVLQLLDCSNASYRGPVQPHEVAITEQSQWLATGPRAKAVLRDHHPFARLEDLRPHFDLLVGSSGDAVHVESVRSHRERINPAYAQDMICSTGLAAALASRAAAREGTKRDGPCRVLLVFGRETTGLEQRELRLCDLLLTIPTFGPEGTRDADAHPSDASLNLSHAVACVLHSLRTGNGLRAGDSVAMAGLEGGSEEVVGSRPGVDLAPLMSLDDEARLHRTLETLYRHGSNSRDVEDKLAKAVAYGELYNIKRALGRAALSQSEFAQIMGLLGRANKRLAEK